MTDPEPLVIDLDQPQPQEHGLSTGLWRRWISARVPAWLAALIAAGALILGAYADAIPQRFVPPVRDNRPDVALVALPGATVRISTDHIATITGELAVVNVGAEQVTISDISFNNAHNQAAPDQARQPIAAGATENITVQLALACPPIIGGQPRRTTLSASAAATLSRAGEPGVTVNTKFNADAWSMAIAHACLAEPQEPSRARLGEMSPIESTKLLQQFRLVA